MNQNELGLFWRDFRCFYTSVIYQIVASKILFRLVYNTCIKPHKISSKNAQFILVHNEFKMNFSFSVHFKPNLETLLIILQCKHGLHYNIAQFFLHDMFESIVRCNDLISMLNTMIHLFMWIYLVNRFTFLNIAAFYRPTYYLKTRVRGA